MRPVRLVEVDTVDSEPAPAAHGALVDDRVERHDGEHLGGHERLVTPAGYRSADGALGSAEAVDLRGIDQVDPQVQGPLGDPQRFS